MVWSYLAQQVLTEAVVAKVNVSHPAPQIFIPGQVTPTCRRLFSLQYTLVPTAQANSMVAFVNSHYGGFRAFDWTNPNDGVNYRVRLDGIANLDLFQPGFIRWATFNFLTVDS